MDEAHKETEKILKRMEKEIDTEYRLAYQDLVKKTEDYFARFDVKNKIRAQAVKDGKLTQEEYQQWLIGQMAVGERWKEMRDTIAEDMTNVAQIARSTVMGYMPEVYALNHNYATFQVEKASKVDTSYTLYDRHTAERVMKDGDFIPKPGKRLSGHINRGEVEAWNVRQAQSAIMQGILQGESISAKASRLEKLGDSILPSDIRNWDKMTAEALAEVVTRKNHASAIRNARTITTGVQNVGRIDAFERANDMGIPVKKQWVATLDERTRHWHREIDGEIVDLDKPFKNEGGYIEYPGDPTADASNIYNCRCTLIPAIGNFEIDASDTELRHDSHLGNMTYDEWKESRYEYSEPITKQEDIARRMKDSYIKDYQYLAGLPQSGLDQGAQAQSLGNNQPKIPVATTRQEAYDIFNTMFASIEPNMKRIKDVFIIENANRIAELNARFGALTDKNIGTLTSKASGSAVAYVGTAYTKSVERAQLGLVAKYFQDEAQVKARFDSGMVPRNGLKVGWSMPADDKYVNTYAITHEYGHLVQWKISKDRQKWGGILGPNFVDDPRKEEKARAREMRKEIIAIAKKNNSNFVLDDNLSVYGHSNDYEFFAEAFANSQCGKPNELGNAMIEWLKQEGY